MLAVRKILPLRGVDDWGDGAFGASRGERKHKGIDLAADVDDAVYSPVMGSVSKLGYPYPIKAGAPITYRYVEITDYKGNRHRVFYIDPAVALYSHVNTNNVIGIAQDIAGKFHRDDRRPMINHIHYEIYAPNGDLINPMEFTT